MNRYKTLTLLFLLLSLTACFNDSELEDAMRADLREQYALWQSKGIENYTLLYQRDCLCEPSYHNSLVENDTVVSSWNVLTHSYEPEEELTNYTTVEYLFELIDFAIRFPAQSIYVDFDDEYGFPREVEIYFGGPWHDFVTYSVEDFVAGDYASVQHVLSVAEQNWESDFQTDYTFSLEVSCFCELHGETLVVTVQDGIAVSATDSASNPVSAEELALIPTVASMFNTVQESIDNEAAGVLADFDPVWGHPLQISINTTPQFADDEFTWTLSNMQVDFASANQNKFAHYSALWQNEKPAAYHYLLDSSVLADSVEPALQYHVEVEDDVPTNAHLLNAYGEWEDFDPFLLDHILMEDYFALIEDALTQGADTVISYYDRELGNPTDIYIDYDAATTGDEVDYYVYINRYLPGSTTTVTAPSQVFEGTSTPEPKTTYRP